MKLTYFKDIDFLQAVRALFKELKVPMNYVADEPTSAQEILKDTYKDNATFVLVDDVYFVGMVDDAAFEQNESLAVDKIKSDYDGVLIFGITLHQRENNLLPTRSQLAEISRAFNREFYYTPVVLVFKYKDDDADYIAFANTERLKYKQAWREGEKSGKVSLLRDINIEKPHRGHEDIINQLKIPASGKNHVDSYAKLYTYWQEVFNVNVLNKKFYQELSNWYFWAVKHVTFPNMPTMNDVQEKFGIIEQQKLDDLIQEHNAKNVIRMLTRLLFTWFIKEKKLIPESLFDLDSLQDEILKDISPYHDENSLFSDANQDSVYYKAILQNLFFASLNCPIDADGLDNRTRGFRGLETYGKHRGVDWMMRYKNHFKNPDKFLEMMNQTVPFLNGGLFECLDDKTQNLYIDGFSDQMTKGEKLVVPDYLFFGIEEKVDLSTEYGAKNKAAKEAAVKGLINILKSYKFTITENTPIEEDVALDPELLGKVFENLLASYNPETKTTARKQTGSFYTPREIVNYMVDESLIAYLKNAISDWGIEDKQLDTDLHQLFSFDTVNPFIKNTDLQKQIIKALDKCTIIDPACGSGAFPMGALQKMVHVLGKVDPNNEHWQDLQLEKAQKETEGVFTIQDKKEREHLLLDINDTFDEALNNPDYARKLFLIENCIYGVDIQSIATQISKLRFFISLVVDQKINLNKENFGIRPLPNLETKFVAANTLIGIDKPSDQLSLYDTKEVKALEKELIKIRHKLFSAKTKDTKLKYRQKDEELRNAIAEELIKSGWANDTAEKLAGWDPYDQNASSPFFDPEWMFDMKEGFDVVIGNPPYGAKFETDEKQQLKKLYKHQDYQPESYLLFIEKGIELLKNDSFMSYIIPNTWITNLKFKSIRKFLFSQNTIMSISHYHSAIFDAVVDTEVIVIKKGLINNNEILVNNHITKEDVISTNHNQDKWQSKCELPINIFLTPLQEAVVSLIESKSDNLDNFCKIVVGMKPYQKGKRNPKQDANTVKKRIYDSEIKVDNSYMPLLRGSDINQYKLLWPGNRWIKYGKWLAEPRESANFNANEKIVLRQTGDSLIAYLDINQFICMNNLHVITSIGKMSLKFILGILNSQLMNFYYQSLNPEVGEALAEVKKENVSRLKIRSGKELSKTIELLVNILLRNSENKTKIFKVIDALVFNLYFPDHMKEKKIDVLQFVEKDIAIVMQGRDFEKLSNTKKEEVIEQLHKTWSHPDNEVRNRIKIFAVRSPEILKPILES